MVTIHHSLTSLLRHLRNLPAIPKLHLLVVMLQHLLVTMPLLKETV